MDKMWSHQKQPDIKSKDHLLCTQRKTIIVDNNAPLGQAKEKPSAKTCSKDMDVFYMESGGLKPIPQLLGVFYEQMTKQEEVVNIEQKKVFLSSSEKGDDPL